MEVGKPKVTAGRSPADRGKEPEPRFPMSVADFLAGDYLRRADVVLFSGKRSLFSRLIRWGTKSPFSHSALVFLIPKRDDGFDSVFLIESVASGVDLTSLRSYAVEQAAAYDIAVKRFERDWFTEEVQRLVRGRMLNYIKADYDFLTIWRIAWSVFQKFLFGLSVVRQGMQKSVEGRHTAHRRAPAEFICSGFVQHGFLYAVKWLVDRGRLGREKIQEVLFKEAIRDASAIASVVLSTTPEDLARTEKLTWKYAIVRGMVHEVATREQVHAAFGARPPTTR